MSRTGDMYPRYHTGVCLGRSRPDATKLASQIMSPIRGIFIHITFGMIRQHRLIVEAEDEDDAKDWTEDLERCEGYVCIRQGE